MPQPTSDHTHLHARHRERGVNPLVYWLVRALFQPFFHLYFRLSRIGREHVPESGPVIFAANHRSFLDPFVIATIARRPMYYVAKEELFRHRLTAWFLNSLGAFPVRRGKGDADMLATAKAILARGDAVLMFPEGTRIRPGSLGRPTRAKHILHQRKSRRSLLRRPCISDGRWFKPPGRAARIAKCRRS